MDPITAAILVGAITSGISMYQSNKQSVAAAKAAKEGKDDEVKNQNRLVEDAYGKRKQALGLGQKGGAAGGLVASQSGGVLTSVTDGNQASGL